MNTTLTTPALCDQIRTVLQAAGFAESPTGLDVGPICNAAAWPYGFLVEDWPGRPWLATVGLWDQVFRCDRTPAQAALYRVQLQAYQGALHAAGYSTTWLGGQDSNPYLAVEEATV